MKRIFCASSMVVAVLIPTLCFAQSNYKGYKGGFMPYSFTGYYLGANIGWKWESFSTDINTDAFERLDGVIIPEQTFAFDTNNNVLTGGGQIGFNYQVRHLLFGVEADWNKMNVSDEVDVPFGIVSPVFLPSDCFKVNSHWESSYRIRLGYVLNNWLFYGTAGIARINIQVKTNFVESELEELLFGGEAEDEEDTLTGGTVGIGTEYAITNHWSVGLEYRYASYGGTTLNMGELSVPNTFLTADTEVTAKVDNLKTNQVLAKANFRFVG